MIGSFFISLAVFLVLDWVWFQFFMKAFALRELNSLLRLSPAGELDVSLPFALVAYVVMGLFVAVFLYPLIIQQTLVKALLHSALLGLLVFGIFDFTNAALFKNYSVPFLVADVLWGGFIYAVSGCIIWFVFGAKSLA